MHAMLNVTLYTFVKNAKKTIPSYIDIMETPISFQ